MKKLLFITLTIVITIYVFISKSYLIDETTFSIDDGTSIYLNGKLIMDDSKDIFIKNKKIYISARYLKENNILDSFWDKNEKIITIFDEYIVDKLTYENQSVYLNNISISNDSLIINNDKLLFSIDFLNNEYKKDIVINEKSNDIFIEDIKNKYIISNDTKLRNEPSYLSKKIKNLIIGDEILVYEEVGKNWLLVRTNDYEVGYIKKDFITAYSKELKIEYWSKKGDQNIVLAWDYFSRKLKDFEETDIPYALNTIAPTWH